jgi:hypothetical protein
VISLRPATTTATGVADLAIFRASTGTFWIQYLGASYPTSRVFGWGGGGDIPVPGDYDGDGKTDFAIFRPSTGIWYVAFAQGGGLPALQWGNSADIPVNALQRP